MKLEHNLDREASDRDLETLRVASARSTDRPQPAVALARGCIRAGRIDEAEAALVLARDRGAGDRVLFQLEHLIAKARGDWNAAARWAQSLVDLEETPSAQSLLALASMCRRLNDAVSAERAAHRALGVDPAMAQAVAILAWAAYTRGDVETAIKYNRRMAELEPDRPRWRAQLAAILNVAGRPAEARDEIASIRDRWPSHPLVAKAATHLSSNPSVVPPDIELRRAPVVDTVDQDFLVAEGEGATGTALVFTDINDEAQGLPIEMFDRYLAQLNLNAIYLKDFSRLLYFRGIVSAGSYAKTLDVIRQAIRRTGADYLSTIGLSAGGGAAIRYGVDLNARRILCFGGPTFSGNASLSSPLHQIIEQRLTAAVGKEAVDAKHMLTSGTQAAKTDLFFGADMPCDRAYALYLEGVRGVTLHPQPGLNDHGVAPFIAAKSSLTAIFREMLLADERPRNETSSRWPAWLPRIF